MAESNTIVLDTFHNTADDSNAITFGGIDESSGTDKITSYLDFIGENETCVDEKNSEELVETIIGAGWGEDLLEEEDNYFYFEIRDPMTTAQVGFKEVTDYYKDNAKAPDKPIDRSKFIRYYESPTFQYSYDKENWFDYTLGDSVNIGLNQSSNIVYFRGDNVYSWYDRYSINETITIEGESVSVYYYYLIYLNAFINNSSVNSGGNIMSLRYKEFKDINHVPCIYAFSLLFYRCSLLKTSPLLPCININSADYGGVTPTAHPAINRGSYKGMFSESGLIEAPVLPAKTLGPDCYSYMFTECTSLITVPELKATVLGYRCYYQMFRGCSALINVPKISAEIMGKECCCLMFEGCTALTVAPELSATRLGEGSYALMFKDCTALTTIPKLPAMILADYCYEGMFYGCSSLTVAPELPATTLYLQCYCAMFANCTALTVAPELPATKLNDYCYGMGCIEISQYFSELGYITGMFEGCTALKTPPALPATTLVKGCYGHMFEGCTALTSIPKLPATTLVTECYYGMFKDSNIIANASSSSPCTKSYRIPTSGTGEGEDKAMTEMFNSKTSGEYFAPSINTTFYINVSSF